MMHPWTNRLPVPNPNPELQTACRLLGQVPPNPTPNGEEKAHTYAKAISRQLRPVSLFPAYYRRMLRRQPVFLVAAIVFAVDVYAANSWSVVHCNPVDAAEATGIRILNEGGTELFRVCQDGSLLPQTGFTNVTSDQGSDFLFVTQVGAKACE